MPIRDLACTSVFRFVETPPDQAIAACGSANVGRLGDVEPQRLAVRDQRDQPGAAQLDVEQPAGEHPGRAALDPRHVPLDARLEGEDVRAVDGQRVVVEAQHVDEHRVVGEEHLAGARGLHQPQRSRRWRPS